MKTENTDFQIELVIDLEHRNSLAPETREWLHALAENALRKLAQGYTDISGVYINITAPSERPNIPINEVTVATAFRPKNVAASKKASDPIEALRMALRAVGRTISVSRCTESLKVQPTDP